MTRTACLLVSLAAAACAGDGVGSPGDEPSHFVRDSAGVQIVESARPRWTQAERWRLSPEPLFTIESTDGADETLLLDPASIDVDSRGRIIVADGDQVGWQAILVYDSLGRFELRAGGPGEGPGEYGQLWWASAYRGDSIVGFDMARDRVHVFDPSGRYVRQVQVPPVVVPRGPPGTPGFVAGMDYAYGDGSFLSYPRGLLDVESGPGPVWFRHLLLRQSPDGAAWDTLGTFEIFQRYWDGERASQYWFGAIPVHAVGESELYFGRGESYEIGRYDAEGRLTRLVRRPHTPEPLTDEMKQQVLDWYMQQLGASSEAPSASLDAFRARYETAVHPEVLPAYRSALLDPEGNLWVEKYTGPPGMTLPAGGGPVPWSVFDSAGVWLGEVEIPAGFELRKVTRDRALGFRTDAFGVKEVDVYALVRPGG